MSWWLALIGLLLAPVCTASTWKNSAIRRVVSVKESVAEVRMEFIVLNTGKTAADEVILSMQRDVYSKIGFLSVTAGSKDLVHTVNSSVVDSDDFVYISVSLPSEVPHKQTFAFAVVYVLGHCLKAFPEKTLLMEPNMVLLELPLHVSTPYHTLSEQTVIKGFKKIDSFEPVEGGNLVESSSSSSAMVSWSFNNISPSEFNKSYLRVHAFHSPALPFFKSVKRVFDVSHWGGMVSVSEEYALHNEAAGLESEFSRIPITVMKHGAGKLQVDGVVQEISGILPRYAVDVQYFDVIGNISTSTASREGKKYLSVNLQPRFPILGGWKDEFQFSYSLPGKHVLSHDSETSEYVLSVPLNHPFNGKFTDEMEIEVMLPEGAYDVTASRNGEDFSGRIEIGKRFGWIDTPVIGGHTLVRIRPKSGQFFPERDALNTKFQIRYKLRVFAMLRQPLLICAYLFVLFAIYIGLSKLAIALSLSSSEKAGFISQALSSQQYDTVDVREQKKRK